MLYLLHNNQAWWLYLSIVAKYAYFYKMFDGHNHKNISYCENCDFPEEIEIITILKKHAIIPLTEQIVSLQIPEFKLREYISGPVEIPTIENILFCDV